VTYHAASNDAAKPQRPNDKRCGIHFASHMAVLRHQDGSCHVEDWGQAAICVVKPIDEYKQRDHKLTCKCSKKPVHVSANAMVARAKSVGAAFDAHCKCELAQTEYHKTYLQSAALLI